MGIFFWGGGGGRKGRFRVSQRKPYFYTFFFYKFLYWVFQGVFPHIFEFFLSFCSSFWLLRATSLSMKSYGRTERFNFITIGFSAQRKITNEFTLQPKKYIYFSNSSKHVKSSAKTRFSLTDPKTAFFGDFWPPPPPPRKKIPLYKVYCKLFLGQRLLQIKDILFQCKKKRQITIVKA